jgi:leukotriene-A4 hydrolase
MAHFGYNADPTRLKFSQRGIDPESVVSYIPYEKGYAFLVRLERVVGRKAFDAFTLAYIRRHRFGSITTETFLEELKRELPEAARRVDLDAWIYQPGLPADIPDFESPLIDAVSQRLFDFQEGRLPRRAGVASWTTAQTYLFLQFLPRVLPTAHCRALEEAFDLTRTRIPHFLSHFYEIAIRSGYREVLPRAEGLVAGVGRIFIIHPVFLAMVETEWTRARARPLFERIRDRHHPITVLAMEQVLEQHGL